MHSSTEQYANSLITACFNKLCQSLAQLSLHMELGPPGAHTLTLLDMELWAHDTTKLNTSTSALHWGPQGLRHERELNRAAGSLREVLHLFLSIIKKSYHCDLEFSLWRNVWYVVSSLCPALMLSFPIIHLCGGMFVLPSVSVSNPSLLIF